MDQQHRPAAEPPSRAGRLVSAATALRDEVAELRFAPPVTHVYNPLEYAFAMHQAYLERFGDGPKEVVFFGMNPGPWGMAQTGIPFGEVGAVRNWLQLDEPVEPSAERPVQHPKRPIEGLACRRSEVSGRRLWGAFQRRFKSPEHFFAHHFVANYCPLLFIEDSGRNRTPDKLAPAERDALTAACDRHAATVIRTLEPRVAIGIGRYARLRIAAVAEQIASGGETAPEVAELLHPSPANPRANRGWESELEQRMRALELW